MFIVFFQHKPVSGSNTRWSHNCRKLRLLELLFWLMMIRMLILLLLDCKMIIVLILLVVGVIQNRRIIKTGLHHIFLISWATFNLRKWAFINRILVILRLLHCLLWWVVKTNWRRMLLRYSIRWPLKRKVSKIFRNLLVIYVHKFYHFFLTFALPNCLRCCNRWISLIFSSLAFVIAEFKTEFCLLLFWLLPARSKQNVELVIDMIILNFMLYHSPCGELVLLAHLIFKVLMCPESLFLWWFLK